jgi:hypothetical protein
MGVCDPSLPAINRALAFIDIPWCAQTCAAGQVALVFGCPIRAAEPAALDHPPIARAECRGDDHQRRLSLSAGCSLARAH